MKPIHYDNVSSEARRMPGTNGAVSDAPSWGLVRPVSSDTNGVYTFGQPNTDGQFVWVNGPGEIPVGSTGEIITDGPVYALYESGDGTPAVGETWGAGASSWKLRKNVGGFVVVGSPDTSLGIVPVERVGATSPLSTKGDLWGFSTENVRVVVGTDGYVLTADSKDAAGVSWQAKTSGAVTKVAATAPAAGFTISGSPITTDGTFVFALANDLAAVEGLSGTGLAVRTATDTWTVRTLTGTSNRVTVTNGDGVSGNPTVDISASYVGQASITTLGTIGTGTWQGTAVGIAYGGTGATTAQAAFDALSGMSALGDTMYGGASGTRTVLAGNTTTTKKFLRQTGDGKASAAPAWDTVVAGDMPLFNGFTNATPASADRFPFYDDSGAANADCSFAELVAAVGAATGPSPGVPTSLTVTAVGDQSVALSWTAPTGVPPASTYNVYRATVSGMSTNLTYLGNTASTTYTNNTGNGNAPSNGTTYYYAVIAVTSTGGTSGYSNVVSATPQAAYLLDTFSGSTGSLHTHLMDIGPGGVPNSTGWSELTADWSVDGSGLASNDGSADPAYAVSDAGYADCTVTATFTTSSDAGQGGMGVFVRATDENNGWLVDWGNSNFQLFEVNAGVYTARDSEAPSGWATSTTYTVSVTLSGNSISATIGSQTLTYSSSFNNTADKHGLKTDNDTGQTFTIFQVSP